MTLTITIDCDNAAFEEEPEAEMARILIHCATMVRNGAYVERWQLRDINGNAVGEMRIA